MKKKDRLTLEDAFWFSPEDLDMNRRGEISPAQIQFWREKQRELWPLVPLFILGTALLFSVSVFVGSLRLAYFFVGLIVILMINVFIIVPPIERHIKNTPLVATILGFEILLALSILSLILAGEDLLKVFMIQIVGVVVALASLPITRMYSYHRFGMDLEVGEVGRASGAIHLDIEARDRQDKFWVIVGGERFEVDKIQLLTLKNGDPYHIYYLQSSRKILSIEPVPLAESNPL